MIGREDTGDGASGGDSGSGRSGGDAGTGLDRLARRDIVVTAGVACGVGDAVVVTTCKCFVAGALLSSRLILSTSLVCGSFVL